VGACYPEGGAPYAPYAQIVQQVLGASKNGLELPDFVLAEMISLAPELSLEYPDISTNPALDLEAGQRRLFDSVAVFSQTLSHQRPLLLVVEALRNGEGRAYRELNFLYLL